MLQTRLFQILMYMLRNRKATLLELAEHFDVNIRTIQRDIDRLSIAGVPIRTKQGFDGGVFIDENYKLSKNFLSDKEIETIVYALVITKGMSSEDKASNIISKLVSFLFLRVISLTSINPLSTTSPIKAAYHGIDLNKNILLSPSL